MQMLCITSHDFPSFDVIAFTETCEIMPICVCRIILYIINVLVFIEMNKTHSTKKKKKKKEIFRGVFFQSLCYQTEIEQ